MADSSDQPGSSGLAPETSEDPASRPGTGFSDRVLVLFGSQVITAGLGIVSGFVLARLIGPSGKGEYYLLTFLTPTLMVLAQLGLPQAFGFFSARLRLHGLVRKTIVLTIVAVTPVLVGAIVLLPVMEETILRGVDTQAVAIPLLALPLLLNATFTTGIVVGRQAARWMAFVNISVSVASMALILGLVGWYGLGVWGALVAYLVMQVLQTAGFLVAATRVSRPANATSSPPYRALFDYGLPFYPGTLAQFLGNRVDVYLIALLLADPTSGLGFYSIAVSMAELVFFFPNAVATFFFPHVAGATREDADRQVPTVSRVTLLLTAAMGLAVVPVATIAIPILLPAFTPSLPALYVLLPGVVAVSVTKVLSGYVSGLGRTGLTSVVAIAAFIINVILNVILIPRFGIVGASAASLVSYSISSVIYSFIGARLAGARPLDFWIPRSSDVRFATSMSVSLVRRLVASVPRPS